MNVKISFFLLVIFFTSCNENDHNYKKIYEAGLKKILDHKSGKVLKGVTCYSNIISDIYTTEYFLEPTPKIKYDVPKIGKIDTFMVVPIHSTRIGMKLSTETMATIVNLFGEIKWIDKEINDLNNLRNRPECNTNLRVISPIYYNKRDNVYFFKYLEGTTKVYFIKVDQYFNASILHFMET